MPRILNPVVLVVDGLPDLCKDQQVKAYVDSTFGSVEQCRQVSFVPASVHSFVPNTCVYVTKIENGLNCSCNVRLQTKLDFVWLMY